MLEGYNRSYFCPLPSSKLHKLILSQPSRSTSLQDVKCLYKLQQKKKIVAQFKSLYFQSHSTEAFIMTVDLVYPSDLIHSLSQSTPEASYLER